MKLLSSKFFLTLLLLTLSAPIHPWALLQGKRGSAHASEKDAYIKDLYKVYSPFYTGPLLAPSADVVPKGLYNIQPYFYWKRTYGTYTSDWHKERTRSNLQYQFLNVFQYGLTNFMDVNLVVQAFLNRKQNQHFFGYGDTNLSFGFQMLEAVIGTPVPACSFVVGMTFPSGRYQHLVTRKLGTDAIGGGAYGTNFSLNFQKSFNTLFKKDLDPTHYHPFRFRWSFSYTINSRVHVEGLNIFGGTSSTDCKVKAGNNFTTIFAIEYSITEHWVFATDVQYTITSASKYRSGDQGGVSVGAPENQSWSIAPALEYNINSNFGVIAGAWFSLAGRNTGAFVTGLFSFTWAF